MTRPAPDEGLFRRTGKPKPAAPRRYGRAAGEPPLLGDPRRWGSLIGVAGGMVFVASYSSALGPMASIIAWTLGIAGVMATLFFLYVRPVPLGLVLAPARCSWWSTSAASSASSL